MCSFLHFSSLFSLIFFLSEIGHYTTIQQSAPSGNIYADEKITVTTIPGPLINKILSPNEILKLDQQARQQKQLQQKAEQKQRRRIQVQQAKATSSLPSTTTSSEPSTTTTNTSTASSASVCDPEPLTLLTKSLEDSINTVQAQTTKLLQLEQEKEKMLAEITRLKAPASTTLQKAFPIKLRSHKKIKQLSDEDNIVQVSSTQETSTTTAEVPSEPTITSSSIKTSSTTSSATKNTSEAPEIVNTVTRVLDPLSTLFIPQRKNTTPEKTAAEAEATINYLEYNPLFYNLVHPLQLSDFGGYENENLDSWITEAKGIMKHELPSSIFKDRPVQFIKQALKHKAKEWFYEQTTEDVATPETVFEGLKLWFGKLSDQAELEKNFKHCTQGLEEDVNTFLDRLKKAAKKFNYNISDHEVLQVFKTGLRTYDARKAVSRATLTNEAFSRARNRESVADIKQQERERDLQLLANFPSISTKVSTLCCKKQQQQEHKPNNKV